jgi:hypothetical protein
MTRLKERVVKVYKLNYDVMKSMMAHPAKLTKIEQEISNPSPLRKKPIGTK